MIRKIQNHFQKFFCSLLILLPFLAVAIPMQVQAGNSFVHTHTNECIRIQRVLCDYPHEESSYHEIITRHCEFCGTQTQHSHYITNASCPKTGVVQGIAGTTACLVCHNTGYQWGSEGLIHYRDDKVYICGVGETVAKVTLVSSTGEMTNQDVTLSAGVEVLNPAFAGESFSYSWDGSNWSGETDRIISENGTYTVWVKNQKGEVADTSVTVSNIDKIAPVINGISHDTSGMTKEKIFITVSASDENGITGYSFDGGATWQSDGGAWIQSGRTYRVMVKDAAGNTAFREMKRADFPFPYEPPKESPAPAPSASPLPVPTASSNDSKREQADKKESASKGQGTDKKDRKPLGKESDSDIEPKKNAGGLVPQIVVSQNQLYTYTASQKQTEESATETLAQEAEATVSQAEEGVQEIIGETDTRSDSKSPLSLVVLFVGILLMAGAGSYFVLGQVQSGTLYTMDDTEGSPSFRRVQRVRIQKGKKGYEMTLPAYVAQLDGSGHFRILLSKYWMKAGRNQRISIYTGKRKLVADMEECIDFVL